MHLLLLVQTLKLAALPRHVCRQPPILRLHLCLHALPGGQPAGQPPRRLLLPPLCIGRSCLCLASRCAGCCRLRLQACRCLGGEAAVGRQPLCQARRFTPAGSSGGLQLCDAAVALCQACLQLTLAVLRMVLQAQRRSAK